MTDDTGDVQTLVYPRYVVDGARLKRGFSGHIFEIAALVRHAQNSLPSSGNILEIRLIDRTVETEMYEVGRLVVQKGGLLAALDMLGLIDDLLLGRPEDAAALNELNVSAADDSIIVPVGPAPDGTP